MVTKKLTPKKVPKKGSGGTKKPSGVSPKRKKRPTKKKVAPWWVAGALLLLGFAVLFPYIRSGRLATTGAAVPADARKFCLDISHHNEGIVWDSLRVVVDRRGRTSKDVLHARQIFPVSTVIIKATEGEKWEDRRFAEYWKEAGSREFTRGAYHFFRSSKNPKKQASLYISKVRLRHGDLPPVLDVETMHEGCTKAILNERVLVWLQEVERHYGRKPIVYTSDSYARDILSPEITEHYPMWIARYNREEPRFRDWTMWQFTDKALLYGVSGYVDLSVIK